ncbi:hypothetical protein [Amycolatopsis sp. DG1A-15b]|nr:hypothetical protein [Amycolatopsis sp. DG1A-15b]WIX92409.1 hypothetical protein QRY02_18965 [Amycolatopsis sp. DG1A-15b]
MTETGQGLVDTAGARGTEILDATGTVGDAIDPNLRSRAGAVALPRSPR